jgi:SAM-dependent methyltransferase
MKLAVKAVLSGLATYVPGYDYTGATGGTSSARYCYSVWLRHLIMAHSSGLPLGIPTSVAELGPGDSIGIGMAALLSGVEQYYALDVVPYSDLKNNLAIFDELVQLFNGRTPVPADDEFPSLNPKLSDYGFPYGLLGEAALNAALRPRRVADIKSSIEHADSAQSRIVYRAPWTDPALIQTSSIDMIYSQAVLEHVNDLPAVYRAMRLWLKPTGIMSHQIDYRCHGKADSWNGHWGYSDVVWKVIVGRRVYLLNRAPHSEHMALLRFAGFDVFTERVVRNASGLPRTRLASRFRTLTDDDLTTSGAFIVAGVSGKKAVDA